MNCLVIIKVLEAPGIPNSRMNSVRTAIRGANGRNLKINVETTALCSTVFDKVISTLSPSSPENYMPLRIRCNGVELDTKKSFAENKVTEGAILECQVLIK